jgi:tripartite-type tricarboxylate transporter receptor subunit TctC
MRTPHRRKFLQLASGAAALPVVSRFAWAQTYATRPVTMIVGAAAGGPTDVIARIVAEHMSRTLGQQVVIENVPGAGGTIGGTRAMRAVPDGHTLVMGNMGTHAASVALVPNLAYKPDVDFEAVGLAAGTPVLVVARKDFPAKDLPEFIAYAKANVGKLNWAHAGVGSASFTTCLLFNHLLQIKPVPVPFNGTAPTMNALLGGQVDYFCDQVVSVVQQVQAGTIKGFAVGTPERNPALPNVPTAKEGKLPEFDALAWNAVFAPKGTPKPVLDKLAQALDLAVDDDGVRKRLLDLGAEIPKKSDRGQQPLAALVKSEIARWTSIINAANK